ncbi:MAG: ATP-binding protein [Planctomycetaceae bacterium]|nr:ATP-binding protein [Planctomycetaceae bacterium]
MITRLYVDNYKCLVNFEWLPASLQLILGDNGSGKSTVFDVLGILRDFIVGGTGVDSAFREGTLTAWDRRQEQTFELNIEGDGVYRYRLSVEHELSRMRRRVKSEELTFDEKKLYCFDGSDAHLFRDDGSRGPSFPFDWSRSAIATIPDRHDNRRLTWFRDRLKDIYVFSPDPRRMAPVADREVDSPGLYLEELVGWLRHLSQQSFEVVNSLRESLRDGVLESFRDFRLERRGESGRVLQFDFEFSGPSANRQKPFSLSLNDLSDGQRCLFALFTMLHAAVKPGAVLCVDEPDNFVALRELQPWLTQLSDRVQDQEGQCLLISHHPELIDYLAAQHGVRFFREEAGLVTVKPFEWTNDEVLPPSEIVARGWE